MIEGNEMSTAHGPGPISDPIHDPTTTIGSSAPQGSRTRNWSSRARRIGAGRAGLVIIFVWAFAEAFMWPLIPDSALMALAFAAPAAIWRLWAMCTAGSIAGGMTGVLLGRIGVSWPLPLVTDRMRETTSGWMVDGASSLIHQPFSGVPYKAFVSTAGRVDVDVVDWALWTAITRGGRMLGFGLVGAAAGWVLWHVIPVRFQAATHAWVYTTGAVLLLTGLGFVVVAWS